MHPYARKYATFAAVVLFAGFGTAHADPLSRRPQPRDELTFAHSQFQAALAAFRAGGRADLAFRLESAYRVQDSGCGHFSPPGLGVEASAQWQMIVTKDSERAGFSNGVSGKITLLGADRLAARGDYPVKAIALIGSEARGETSKIYRPGESSGNGNQYHINFETFASDMESSDPLRPRYRAPLTVVFLNARGEVLLRKEFAAPHVVSDWRER